MSAQEVNTAAKKEDNRAKSLDSIRQDVLTFRAKLAEQQVQRQALFPWIPVDELTSIYEDADSKVSDVFAEGIKKRIELLRVESKLRSQDKFQVWKRIDEAAEKARQADESEKMDIAPTLVVQEPDDDATEPFPPESPKAGSSEPEDLEEPKLVTLETPVLSLDQQRRQLYVDRQVQELLRFANVDGAALQYTSHELFPLLVARKISDPRRKEAVEWLENSVKRLQADESYRTFKRELNEFHKRTKSRYQVKASGGIREVYDYYEVLGVARTATTEEIKGKLRQLSRIFHPDTLSYITPGSEEAQQALQIQRLINEARDQLTDPERRKVYDRAIGVASQSGPQKSDQPRRETPPRPRAQEKPQGATSSEAGQGDPFRREYQKPNWVVAEKLKKLREATTLADIRRVLLELNQSGWDFHTGVAGFNERTYSAEDIWRLVRLAEEAVVQDERHFQEASKAIPNVDELKGNASLILQRCFESVQVLKRKQATLTSILFALKELTKYEYVFSAVSNGRPVSSPASDIYWNIVDLEDHADDTEYIYKNIGDVTSMWDLRSKVFYELREKRNLVQRMGFKIPNAYKAEYDAYISSLK